MGALQRKRIISLPTQQRHRGVCAQSQVDISRRHTGDEVTGSVDRRMQDDASANGLAVVVESDTDLSAISQDYGSENPRHGHAGSASRSPAESYRVVIGID